MAGEIEQLLGKLGDLNAAMGNTVSGMFTRAFARAPRPPARA